MQNSERWAVSLISRRYAPEGLQGLRFAALAATEF